jgi:hypothetical protein
MTKRSNTPVLKPQSRVQFEQINFKIDSETLNKLRGYAKFINSEQGYVIREALNYLFESDTTFQDFFKSRSEPEHSTPQLSGVKDTPSEAS